MIKLNTSFQQSIISATYGESSRIDITNIIKSIPPNTPFKLDNNMVGDPQPNISKYIIFILDDYTDKILKENTIIEFEE